MIESNTEVSITNMSSPINKDDLINVFSKAGTISEFHFYGDVNKAKINYKTPELALECIKLFNHKAIFSNDLHVSIFRNKPTKLLMRKWKLLARNIKESIAYSHLYSLFEKYGTIHHISYYPNQQIASIQFDTQKSAMNCLASEHSSEFTILLAWPQFSSENDHQFLEIHYLPENFDQNSLHNVLKGQVSSISPLYYLPHSHKKISVAFASFSSRSQRQKAISALDGTKILRKMIHAKRLAKTSCFSMQYEGDLSEFEYFIPIKGKHYLEFMNPPQDLDESKLRGICGTFGHIYDVSVLSQCKEAQPHSTSHVAFTTKGPLNKALKSLCSQYEVRRLPKSSPFYHQFTFQTKETEDGTSDNDSEDDS